MDFGDSGLAVPLFPMDKSTDSNLFNLNMGKDNSDKVEGLKIVIESLRNEREALIDKRERF